MREMLEVLQTRLLKENKGKSKNDPEISGNLEDKSFVFMVSNLTDSLKRKKVMESIETMQNEFIGISCQASHLPEGFSPLSNMEALRKGYKESYEALITICQNYEPEEQDDSQ